MAGGRKNVIHDELLEYEKETKRKTNPATSKIRLVYPHYLCCFCY